MCVAWTVSCVDDAGDIHVWNVLKENVTFLLVPGLVPIDLAILIFVIVVEVAVCRVGLPQDDCPFGLRPVIVKVCDRSRSRRFKAAIFLSEDSLSCW